MVCENPFVSVGINLWNGLCGNGVIIGSFFFERNVNGQDYLLMINQDAVPQFQLHFDRQENGAFQHLWWAKDVHLPTDSSLSGIACGNFWGTE
jgi:hypothetical protein